MTDEAVLTITRSVWFSFKWELSEIESVALCLCETASNWHQPVHKLPVRRFQQQSSSSQQQQRLNFSPTQFQVGNLAINTGQNKVLIPLKDSDTLFSHTFQRCEQQQFLPRMMQFRSCPVSTKVLGGLRPELGPKQLQHLPSVRNTG